MALLKSLKAIVLLCNPSVTAVDNVTIVTPRMKKRFEQYERERESK